MVGPVILVAAVALQAHADVALAVAGLAVLASLCGGLMGVIAILRSRGSPMQGDARSRALAAAWIGGIATIVMLSILWPSYQAYRAGAMAVRSLANLRAVGNALIVYQQANGACPDDLAVLAGLGYISADGLQDPARGKPDSTCDYFYVCVDANGPPPSDPNEWVVTYSDPVYRDGERVCVLFADQSARTMREPAFSQLLGRFLADLEDVRGVPPTIVAPK